MSDGAGNTSSSVATVRIDAIGSKFTSPGYQTLTYSGHHQLVEPGKMASKGYSSSLSPKPYSEAEITDGTYSSRLGLFPITEDSEL